MILVVTGTRTFGELEYGKVKKGTGKLDPAAVMCVTSLLDGLWIWATMGYMVTDLHGFTIIEGGCPTGLDRIAREWAHNAPTHGYEGFPDDRSDIASYPDQPPFKHMRIDADWSLGKRGGPIRNIEMLEMAQAMVKPNQDILVAGFFDRPEEESKGTTNCIESAKRAGLPVATVRYYERV